MSTAAASATGRTTNPYQKIAYAYGSRPDYESYPVDFGRPADFRIADHTAVIPRADINWKQQKPWGCAASGNTN
jgi:hypothetical protein